MNERHYLLFLIIGIVSLPFLLLWSFGKFELIDFNHVFPLIYEQTVGTIINNFVGFLLILLTAVILILISTILLFEIKIEKDKEKEIQKTWYWKYFVKYLFNRKRRLWHVMLGYYITIITLTPILSKEILLIQVLLNPMITNYQTLILAIIFITPILLLARVLSKLEFQILDTNLGVFIIMVYVSEVIFVVISGAYVPFEEFQSFLSFNSNNIEGIFMAYGTLATMVFFVSGLDWFLVTKVLKKPL